MTVESEECFHFMRAKNVFGEWICLACRMPVPERVGVV